MNFFYTVGDELTGLIEFNVFTVKIYLKQWFTCYCAIEAPFNDLLFLRALRNYRQNNDHIAREAEKVLGRHLWYISEILIGFSFFDERLNHNDLLRMVAALNRETRGNIFQNNNVIANDNIHISDLVSKETKNFFYIIGHQNTINFINQHPSQWKQDDEYKKLKEIANGLSVVNDPAERAIGLITEFNASVTRDETQKQFLMQVVENHRQQFPSTSSASIKEQLTKM